MKEFGAGAAMLGIALIAFPLYSEYVGFIHLLPMHAQLAGGVVLAIEAASFLLSR